MKASVITPDLCFDTLSNQLRVDILKVLQNKPMNVTELAEKLNVEQSRLSHSLQMLRDCNYLTVQVQGKQRVYALRENVLQMQGKNMFEHIESHIKDHCKEKCSKL